MVQEKGKSYVAVNRAGGVRLGLMENGWTAPSGSGKLLVILRYTVQLYPYVYMCCWCIINIV